MIKNVLLYLIITIAVVALVGYRINTTSKIESYYKIEAKPTYEEISVGTISSGIVQEVLVKPGDLVKKDTVLMRINNTLVSEKYRILLEQNDLVRAVEMAELKNRIDNFEIKAPADSIVLGISSDNSTYVRESDIVLTLVPLDSFNYSFFYDDEVQKISTPELHSYFKRGSNVLIRKMGSFDSPEQTKIIDVIVQKDPRDGVVKSRILVQPTKKLGDSTQLVSNMEVLFEKETLVGRSMVYIEDFFRSIR